MSYYIRKVDSQYWEDILPEDNHLNMSVDGVTNCCKTSSNALSIWKTESNNPYDDYNKKLLTAIALGRDGPAPMTFIFLSDDELAGLELTLDATPGNTSYNEFVDKHRDIINLTLDKIGRLAWAIHKKVNNDDDYNIVSCEEIMDFTKDIFPDINSLPEKNKGDRKWKRIYS
ncbi:hypothetical protein [Raoultella terrigena]|uniref:hypothetical protein n=1 Tax=Raoultella terrigena TaxID=577 RepID=UPI00384E2241